MTRIILVVMLMAASNHILGIELSENEDKIWQLEKNYWSYTKVGDVRSYKKIWDEEFVGWPCGKSKPSNSVSVDLVTNVKANGWEITYELLPMAIRLFDDIAVTHYQVTNFEIRLQGKKMYSAAALQMTHTWRNRKGEWKIVTGMCKTSES